MAPTLTLIDFMIDRSLEALEEGTIFIAMRPQNVDIVPISVTFAFSQQP